MTLRLQQILLLATLFVTAAASASAELSVVAADGRALSGVMDPRTDDERLYVRRDEGPISLTASVAWGDIESAEQDGRALRVDDLRVQRAEYVAAPANNTFLSESPSPPFSRVPLVGPVRAARVRSLSILDACLANLDKDAEPDGFAITIAALDEHGQPTTVRGTLAVRLFGQRQPQRSSALDFATLDQWTVPVCEADFVDGVATYELPFRRTAPEFQFPLYPDAILEARLGAFGHGNYAASTQVLLREYSTFRDRLQLFTGSRFIPREWHGRNPSSMPTSEQGLWLPFQY
jgi:hypothetical protein